MMSPPVSSATQPSKSSFCLRTHGLVLYEIGDPIRHVYFPNNALISLVKQMTDGKVVEVGLIGNMECPD